MTKNDNSLNTHTIIKGERTYTEKNIWTIWGFEPRPLLITSQMLYQLSHWGQVEEEHFIDNVYYIGQVNSAASLYLS